MAERMRLLQIVDSLEQGGMENVLVQLLSRLDPERYHLEVCCLSRSGPFEKRLPPSVAVSVLGKEEGFRWSAVRALRQLIKRGGFDVVHTHHLGGLIYATLACPRLQHPRLIHSEHSLWEADDMSPKRKWQRRLLYRRADAVFTVSHRQAEQIREQWMAPPQLRTILNGVDSERFQPGKDRRQVRESLGLRIDGLWFGMVARFGRQKRHFELIEAFERLALENGEANLLLVGDGGPEKTRVLERLERSPIRKQIHWAGYRSDPVPWYQAMDALVVSSANEGLPNAVLEAMACGLPLVANDVCGVREIALPGTHGWIEDLGTVDLLAAALRRASIEPRERLQEMGAAAREHVRQRFSLDAMIVAYDRLYTSVALARPPNGSDASAQLKVSSD